MTDPKPIHDGAELACNCHYPIGLVIFLIFTVFALLTCICICCIDITKCSFYQKKKQRPLLRRNSTFDPRFMDGPRIERKFSMDPRLFAVDHLKLGRQSSMIPYQELNGYSMYFPTEALVTTV